MSFTTSSQIPINAEISDIRTSSEFKGISFSNFKKTEVKNQLIENIKRGKIEPACYWCAELVCSGHFMDIWEIVIHYLGKHIHLGNPKLAVYLERRYTIFRNIMVQGHYVTELDLRNNINIRKLFVEMICILSISNKKPSFEAIKINKVEEFDITQMTERLKAPSVKYIDSIFQSKDPKELFIPLNEFAYNLSNEKRNINNACYWIEWIIEFDIICKNKKEQCRAVKRNQYHVESKLQRDVIWIVWDIILHYSNETENPFIITTINALLELFCIKYTTGSSKKRKYLLYFAVELLTEPVQSDIEMISDKNIVHVVVEKVNELYRQIKKNEKGPNVGYLYSNLESAASFEQSLQKIELINSMTNFEI
jgi:hypothetical protein